MSISASNSAASQQVRIQLLSQHDDLQLPDQTGPILVPTKRTKRKTIVLYFMFGASASIHYTALRRQDLSLLVNELLENENRVPLEFFIRSFPLRVSLEEWLSTHGVSTEDLVEVEYARAQLPPVHMSSFKHDDWIGAVDVLSASHSDDSTNSVRPGHERILSGSFDGSVRIWNMSGQILATSEGAGPSTDSGNWRLADGRPPMLLSAGFISPSSIVASGWRAYLRIWNYEESEDSSAGGGASLSPSLDLYGHKMAVNSIRVNSKTKRILSGADDGAAMLWSTNAKDAPAADPSLLASSATSNKRRKLNTAQPMSRGPTQTLSGHTASVKGVAFHPTDPTVAYTASVDSTVKTWDLETAQAVQSKTPGGPHTPHRSIYAMKHLGLVATGTSDRRILLMDPREDAARQVAGTLQGHKNAVTSLDGDPDSQYGICSASFDGCVRIWDIRVAQDPIGEKRGSTFKIPRQGKGSGCDRMPAGEGVKLFSVRWDTDVGIVSAGEDRRLQIDRMNRNR